MPLCGKLLSEFEHERITALIEENYSISTIAKKINRSFNAVKNFINRKGTYKRKSGQNQS